MVVQECVVNGNVFQSFDHVFLSHPVRTDGRTLQELTA
ncbi:hypothetical protein AALP_AA3G374000 [Arabis alpina]|uniref:Uncharacterized protein n=1 Tax=Arabis alpina TaxID=50452 RepID=A0A087HE93_ARAAL|nr:hypothetical protein AALP_AA3G374000 [Arabis alpina]